MTSVSKRHTLAVIPLALAISAVIGLAYLLATTSNEPIYKGKHLSTWLDHHVASSSARPPYGSPGWHEANEAIRQIGSAAVPTLVKMIEAKDKPKWAIKAIDFLRARGLPVQRYRYASNLHAEAEYAFEILGEEGKAAVPGLIQIYKQNISRSSQMYAALSLGNIGRDAREAIPTFLKDFNHPDPNVRFYAVSAVMSIRGEPEQVIPPFTAALGDSNVNVRWNALVGLSRFGRAAESAIPTILEMLNDPGKVGDSPIKEQVETTIWRIAPENSSERIVVEHNSPIVKDGRTTQALKVLYDGNRKTLIEAGKPIPVLRQYWESDPRPGLTLYRGDSTTDDNDELLGHFEVMNIPEDDSINISTLCIITEKGIFLCARDNNHYRFLKIRRSHIH